jgi:acetyl-CoA acetyltransferase
LTTSFAKAGAVVGVGASSFARRPDTSVLEMAAEALTNALQDAALEKEALDGLIVQIGSPRGADYDVIAQTFGLDLKYCSQTWPHGRFTATVITQAVMAVASGLATRVACILAMKNSDLGRIGEATNPFFFEQFRENGGPHGEEGHIGMSSPVGGAAMALDLYCRRYAQDRELLSAIPLAFRRHAQLNSDAVMRADLSLADYRAARYIVEPIRLLDCSLVGDGAVCLIISAPDLAQRAGPPPVRITGAQGVQAGRETFIFGPRGLGVGQQSGHRLTQTEARAQPVFKMAGVTPDKIDVLGVYDSFSTLPVYVYEDFGFCAAGEGLPWIQAGRIELGGAIPTNTNGGQLSHAQVNGWGQIRELILQLRGMAHGRQVKNASTAMWATACGDALIFQRG